MSTVQSFGCRLNIAEGEAIRAATENQANLVVINSCAVTAEAVRQAGQAVRKARRANPAARIMVTGCAAQVEPARFAAMPEVSAVIGNREKRLPSSYREGFHVGDIFTPGRPITPVVSGAGHARAFVEVQTGCNHRCTYCIIPFGRGNSASAAPDAIIDVIRRAVAGGQREVVLTGVDITGYEGGLGPLVARILRDVPELPRLRLSSLDPVEIDPLLCDLITGESRIMPHVHLSLQAGDDMILKRMKRRHCFADAASLVEKLKLQRPEIAIGADIIAGFPTEDAAMFARSLELADACDIVFGHIFPFSPRPGTPAARMPQVEREVARARAARLRARIAERKAAWLQTLVGTRQPVLVELSGHDGHAPNFARVTVTGTPGAIVDTLVTASDGERLRGLAGG